jgi:hypothetical protein
MEEAKAHRMTPVGFATILGIATDLGECNMTDSDIAKQTAFGYAAFLLLAKLISVLNRRKMLSAAETREMLDEALMLAEKNQTVAPFPEVTQNVRNLIEALLAASKR